MEAAKGGDQVDVSERLGHASVSITADTYQHVSDVMERQAADTVAGLILGGSYPS